ncbi:MAG: paraquat-inducible protein A [Neptuniibacter sp.]
MSNKHSLMFQFGLLAALILLVAGLISPMLTMSKFYFFESSFSVLGGISQLFQEGKWLIAIIVALFSVVIPFIKLAFLFQISRSLNHVGTEQKKYLKLMHDYGRWAMLDVLVVAVLIVTVKLGAVASIEIHWGLYVFAAAVVLIMFLTHTADKVVHERT